MSSKRRQRRNQCEAKLRHPNAHSARWALRKLLISPGFNGGTMDIYHCGFCKGWHVGHARDQRPATHKGRRL